MLIFKIVYAFINHYKNNISGIWDIQNGTTIIIVKANKQTKNIYPFYFLSASNKAKQGVVHQSGCGSSPGRPYSRATGGKEEAT